MDMEKNNSSLSDYKTIYQIVYDCTTIATLYTNIKDPILHMMSIPYFALFCHETEKYFNIYFIDGEYANDITDIRNAIKIYGDRFAKSSKRFLTADLSQDEKFRNELRFDFMKQWDIYYNLGIYCDIFGNVLGNTQLIEDTLALKNLNDEERGQKAFEIGREVGQAIGKIIHPFQQKKVLPKIQIYDNVPEVYYIDINTNWEESIFKNNYKKEFNLFALHILSNLGFVNNFLSKLLQENNLWLFRIKYVVTYYSILGIEKMKNYLQQQFGQEYALAKECDIYTAERATMFRTEFRNCMMHYDLYNNSICAIKEKYMNYEIPFFGLVESCYEGKDFKSLNKDITALSKNAESFLRKFVVIDINKLQRL